MQYDADTNTVSYSLSSLEDAFNYNESESDYLSARREYDQALEELRESVKRIMSGQ